MNLDLIKKWEGCSLKAYTCPAGVITIGYGNTYYENGEKIKLGDTITQERAEQLLNNLVGTYLNCVEKHVKPQLNNNMVSALVSFVWNVGCANFAKSTLCKLVNNNPNDPLIAEEFKKWNKANGKVLNGLTNRRLDEIRVYFS